MDERKRPRNTKLWDARVELARLKVALQNVAYYGDGSGVIPCPKDYATYIQPMKEIARKALGDE